MGLSLLYAVVLSAAVARPLPVVEVRPLPARAPRNVGVGHSKSDLIAAAWRDETVAYQNLGSVEDPEASYPAYPEQFRCEVAGGVLTVSYTREGFDTTDLPRVGWCGEGKAAVRFRIRVMKEQRVVGPDEA